MNYFTPIYEEKTKNPSAYLGGYADAQNGYKDAFCVVANSPYVMLNGQKHKAKHSTIYENMNMLVPVCMLGEVYDLEIDCASDGIVHIENDVTLKCGDMSFSYKGVTTKLNVPIRECDGTIYIELRTFAENVLGKTVFQSDYGIVIVSDKEINGEYAKTALRYLIYDRPNADSLKETLLSRNPNFAHPRVIFKPDDFERARRVCENDKNASKWSQSVIAEADEFIAKPLPKMEYDSAGLRLQNLPNVREVLSTYWAHYITGNSKYAEYMVDAAVATCNNYSDWGHTKHYLEVGETAASMGLVFDLFYDILTKNQRDLIADRIIRYVMQPSAERYHGRHPYGGLEWPINPNNWNIVVNKGIIMAALAIGDEYETELCMDMLEKALYSAEHMMPTFAPEGAWGEGVAYWVYTITNLMRAILSLKTALGSDYGICSTPGFLETAYFPFMLCGNSGVFAYHDADRETIVSGDSSVFELAKLLGSPSLATLQLNTMIKNNCRGDIFSVMLYDPSFIGKAVELPLDRFYASSQVATSRSGWDSSATWIGIHAGANDFPHGHIDIGSFEYECGGVKFASDMGRDDYNLPGYWNTKVRNLYISRAEGHNVYVINPDEGAGQEVDANAGITFVESNADGCIYTVDMTPAYASWVKDAKRCFMLSHERKVFTVQDEIVPKDNDEYYWFWQTDAHIKIIEDNKKVILEKQNQRVVIRFDANVDFIIEAGKTIPLPTSPVVDGQLGNLKNIINKITVRFSTKADMPVIFRAVAMPEKSDYTPEEIVCRNL